MDWVRVDVGILSNPKMVRIGHDAVALYLWGLLYAGQHETDGFIPAEALDTVPAFWVKRPKAVVRRLTEPIAVPGRDPGPLWEDVALGTGWRIHDWGQKQPSKVDTDSARAAARERMRRLRSARSSPEHSANTRRTSTERSPDVRDYGTGTEQNEDLGSVVQGLVSPEGGSGGKPDWGDQDQGEVPIPDGLNRRQADLWLKIVKANRQFKQVWPGVFADAMARGVKSRTVTDALSYLAHPDTDLSGVDHPRAYVLATLAEKAATTEEQAAAVAR